MPETLHGSGVTAFLLCMRFALIDGFIPVMFLGPGQSRLCVPQVELQPKQHASLPIAA